MSILSFPRINFRGVFRTNPCTANNDDVMPQVVDRDKNTLGPDVAGKTDEQIRAYLRERVSMTDFKETLCKTFMRSGWNLYGDHSTNFDDTVVTSIVVGPRPEDRWTSKTQDKLIGESFKLLGSASDDPARRGDPVICDLDPTGLITTQLYVGGIQFGSDVPSSTDPSPDPLRIDHDTRGFQDWLNFNSTLGSYKGEQNFTGIGCIMQFSLPASAIPKSVKSDSPGLNRLLDSARTAAGLVVRFRCYEVQPGITDENLYQTFAQGNAVRNPALGYLVGTIGIWETGEPATEPAGRKLQAPYPRPEMKWQSKDGKTKGSVPPAPLPWQGAPALIGNAVALLRQSPAVISLDMVGSFPKYGYRDPDGPQTPAARGFAAPKEKADVGQVELAYIPAGGGAARPIADVDYGLDSYGKYEDLGGIQELNYDPAHYDAISRGTLVLRAKPGNGVNAGVTLLQETTTRLVTDDRGVYLLAGEKSHPIRIKVYERGGPSTTNTIVYLKEYANIIQTDPGARNCTDGSRPNQTVDVRTGERLDFPARVTIPAGQGYENWFEILVSARAGGAAILSYQSDDVVVGPSVPAWSTANYSSIRVYNDDDFSRLYTAGELRWQDVYEAVLRYYYVLFPAMSSYIPLNLADSVVNNGTLIRQRLHSPDNPGFYSTYNMPITRTMSPGKIKLLLDFIAQEQQKRNSEN